MATDADSQLESLELKSWEEKLSLGYVRNDRKVRKRIVDSEIEFSSDVWDTLHDGAQGDYILFTRAGLVIPHATFTDLLHRQL